MANCMLDRTTYARRTGVCFRVQTMVTFPWHASSDPGGRPSSSVAYKTRQVTSQEREKEASKKEERKKKERKKEEREKRERKKERKKEHRKHKERTKKEQRKKARRKKERKQEQATRQLHGEREVASVGRSLVRLFAFRFRSSFAFRPFFALRPFPLFVFLL